MLAEADIPHDKLIPGKWTTPMATRRRPTSPSVIGANYVTNPAARTDTSSPIYGMPILDVDKARTVMVIKRSMPVQAIADASITLFKILDKTLMLFGDAKSFVGSIRPAKFRAGDLGTSLLEPPSFGPF